MFLYYRDSGSHALLQTMSRSSKTGKAWLQSKKSAAGSCMKARPDHFRSDIQLGDPTRIASHKHIKYTLLGPKLVIACNIFFLWVK